MLDIIIGLIVFSPVIIFGVIGPVMHHRNKKKSIAINNQINNAIIDLYEQSYIRSSIVNDEVVIQKTLTGNYLQPLHRSIILHGFGMEETISAKDFHVNIYKSRREIASSMLPDGKYDALTPPNERVRSSTSGDSGSVVLPLLFLGDGAGSSSSGNPSYSGSSDYVGSSDFGGDGGDSGGDGGGSGD